MKKSTTSIDFINEITKFYYNRDNICGLSVSIEELANDSRVILVSYNRKTQMDPKKKFELTIMWQEVNGIITDNIDERFVYKTNYDKEYDLLQSYELKFFDLHDFEIPPEVQKRTHQSTYDWFK